MIARNLMVGDLIQYNGEILRLYEFTHKYAYFGSGHPLNGISLDEIEPIPLTPEILEKNGFVNDNSVYGVRYRWESEDTRTEIRIYSPQDGYSGMTIIKNSYLVDEVSYDLPDVYMVHELQHALKLCGIEKEIVV